LGGRGGVAFWSCLVVTNDRRAVEVALALEAARTAAHADRPVDSRRAMTEGVLSLLKARIQRGGAIAEEKWFWWWKLRWSFGWLTMLATKAVRLARDTPCRGQSLLLLLSSTSSPAPSPDHPIIPSSSLHNSSSASHQRPVTLPPLSSPILITGISKRS
jgi:hypothetical protein